MEFKEDVATSELTGDGKLLAIIYDEMDGFPVSKLGLQELEVVSCLVTERVCLDELRGSEHVSEAYVTWLAGRISGLRLARLALFGRGKHA